MDDFYAARSRLIPPLPWQTFAPPFSMMTLVLHISGALLGTTFHALTSRRLALA